MVNIIAITGGKGGTGKSTVSTSLAAELSKKNKVLLVDADVDCPNDHLILGIKRNHKRDVYQRVPQFDLEKCSKCGKCGNVCKTKAIVSIKGNEPILISGQCNGCGSCKIICPKEAILWDQKIIGKIYDGRYEKGDFKLDVLSGELNSNEQISEFVVNELNKDIEKLKNNYDYIIVDTAAGTHCPVIAALENADNIIAVTEPTPLGAHDLKVILQLLKILKKESKIIINRSDIGKQELINKLALKFKSNIILKVPFSKEIIKNYSSANIINIPMIEKLIWEVLE